MLRITDPDNFARTLGGTSLIAAPLLLGIGEVLRLTIADGANTGTAAHLDAVAGSSTGWQLMTVLDMAAVVLFVPAVLALVHLTRRRAPVLAHLGGGLSLVGLLGAAGHNVFAHVLDGAMARVDGDPSGVLAVVDPMEGLPGFLVVLAMFLVGFIIGPILLAVALHRSRSAPSWAAAGIGAGMLVFANAGTSLPMTLVACGLLVVGMGAVAVRVLSMNDTEWARRGAPGRSVEFVGAGEAAPVS